MKTILVLTDFSKKAENAALFALKLAEKTHANIVLFHMVEQAQPVNVPEAGSWVAEDYDVFKNESLRGLIYLKDHLETQHEPSAFKPAINWFNDMSPDLANTIAGMVKSEHIDLVVMGTRSNDRMSHLFYGSETSRVLEDAGCPVLFVPRACEYKGMHTIVFANDFKQDYTEAIQFVTLLARACNSHIILTHLGPYDNEAFHCLGLIKSADQYAHVSSRLLPLENFGEQLTHFAVEVNADVVVTIHHRGLTLDKLMHGSKSKKMLNQNEVPLLVLPA
jgi:nucleotide-binding universal stress UspA family protein